MIIIHIISFIVIALTAGYLLKVSLSDMLPFVWCGLILVLYVLSFGRLLNLIDYLMPLAAVGTLGYVGIKSKGTELLDYSRGELTKAPFWVYIILVITLPICLSAKMVTWWDDINYWASDLKSLYYLNGFAAKYANVSPQFGDYPPGVQLAKWYLVHMDRNTFREELGFLGYYLFNFSFVMPLFRNIRGKLVWTAPVLAILTWLIPGMAEIYGYSGFCADLSMALIFGGILILAVDHKSESKLYDYICVSLYLSVLVICKSTGAIWALFGVLIWAGVRWKNDNMTFGTKRILRSAIICVLPFVVGASWMGFCLLHRRVTQTTATMVTYITTDKYGLSEYTNQFAKAFIRAFLAEPLHVNHTWIDVSPAVMLVLIIATFVVMNRCSVLDGKSGRYMTIMVPVLGIIYYCVIFAAHITIFATETQYLESSAMIASIERYGAPFMLGTIMFLLWILLDKITVPRLSAFVLIVLMFTNISAAWNGICGYRNQLNEQQDIRASCMDAESQLFVDNVRKYIPEGNTRVCRLRDGGYYRVADTYIAYEVSPVSVISVSYDLAGTDLGSIILGVNQTHASFLYIDEQQTVSAEDNCLSDLVKDGEFAFRTLYYISYEDGAMVLYPIGA